MDRETLTLSLPQPMNTFIASKGCEGRLTTPREYIRSVLRADQQGRSSEDLPSASISRPDPSEALILKSRSPQSPTNRNGREANGASA